MKLLITGAAGFIGSHLADHFVGRGDYVAGVDNLSTGRRDNFPSGGLLHVGDIRNTEDIPRDDWDVIYHCAASYRDRKAWESDASTNVLGTINVVREAERTGAKLIYFQTALCYGPSPASPVKTDAPLDPRGSYAISKTAGEAYIFESGVPHVVLRLANIFGPRNLSGPAPTFYKRLSEGQPCTVVDTRRDFVFIGDLISIATRMATEGSGVYHVGSGRDISILSLYDAVVAAMGVDAPFPSVQERGADDAPTILLDASKTFRDFGWNASTTLGDGISKAVKWYEEHGVTETYTHLAVKG